MSTTTFPSPRHTKLPIADLVQLAEPPAEPLTVTELTLLVGALGDLPALWAPKMRRPERDRWWIQLHGDELVDVWLLTWLPGHATDLHDHGESAAAFTVVRGLLEEIRPTATGGRSLTRRPTGASARIEPGVIHDVRAIDGAPAASIHAYSPPLRQMTYWNVGPDGRLCPDRTVITHEPEQVPA